MCEMARKLFLKHQVKLNNIVYIQSNPDTELFAISNT